MGRRRLVPLTLLLATPAFAQDPSRSLAGLLEQETRLRADDLEGLCGCIESAQGLVEVLDRAEYDEFVALLGRITNRAQHHARFGRGTRPSMMLHEVFRRAHAKSLLRTATHHRRRAEVAWLVEDLKTVKLALDDAKAVVDSGDHFERCLMRTLATHWNSQLGRLGRASDNARVALTLAASLKSSVRAHPQYAPAIRNAIMAAADLYLMDGRHEAVERIVAGDVKAEVSGWLKDRKYWQLGDHREDAGCRPYALLARMLLGDRDAEEILVGECVSGESPFARRALSVIALKLVRAALLRGDDELGRERLVQMRQAFGESGDLARPLVSLETELAIRGSLPIDDSLVERSRATFERLMQVWRGVPRPAGGIGFLHADERAATVANHIGLLAAAKPGQRGLREAFDALLEAHASAADVERPSSEAALSELLSERHGLLVVLPGRVCSALMVVDSKGFELVAMTDAVELRHQVGRLFDAALRQVSADRVRSSWRERASMLCDELLPRDVQGRIAGWRRLTVCGAGMLHNLPFELLPIERDGEVRPLGELVAVDYTSNLVTACRTPARRASERLLLAASLRTERGGNKPERVDRDSLQALCARYEQPVKLFDEQVNSETLIRALRSVDVVHLIGHGFEQRGDYRVGIVFGDGPGEAMFGNRIREIDLALDGVVAILGSCSVGNAPYRRGGEALAASLGGALLQSRARCVMVPMCDVRIGHHASAMRTLHAELARQAKPSEAMLTARRAIDASKRPAAWMELMLMQVHGRGF